MREAGAGRCGMRQNYQTNVKFSTLEDAKAIAKDYEQSVFGKENGVSGNVKKFQELRATHKRHGQNSARFNAVLEGIQQIERLREERVSQEHPEAYENLMVAYADLCTACKEYIDSSRFRFTSVGRQRAEIVKEVYANAEKEVLMIQMRYFEMGSQFKGEGITLRQLFAGETLPQLIQNDAANFSLNESEAGPAAKAERYRLNMSAAAFKNRVAQEARVDARDSSVIAILLEYYQRILSRMDTDPASEDLVPDILNRIRSLCAGNEKSNVLAELSGEVGRVLEQTGVTSGESSEGSVGQSFVSVGEYAEGVDISAVEAEANADQFSDYPVITNSEAKSMAEQNRYNQGEGYTKLYGLAGDRGYNHGYIQTSNSFDINNYLRSQKFGDVSYESHESIGMLNEATKLNRLSHKARFYRLLGAPYLQYALGLENLADANGFAKGTVQAVNAMAGKVITDAGFMCVGHQVDMMFATAPVMLTLLCDEGMPLMATANFGEGEFIFPRNTSYMIIGARKHEGGNKATPNERTFIGISPNGTRDKGVFRGLEIICKVLNPEGIQNQDAQSVESMAEFKKKQDSYVGEWGQHGDGVHREAYLKMARRDMETLTPEEKVAMDAYTTDSGDINRRLRSGEDISDVLQTNISHIKAAMRKHPLPTDITTYRGVDDGMLLFLLNTSPDITPEERNRFIINGKINHDALSDGEGYKVFEGIVFRDPAFVSTSTNRFFAKRWANGLNHQAISAQLKREAEGMPEGSAEKNRLSKQAHAERWNISDITGSHVMNMHLKKGTRALFSDTMYTSGNGGRPRGQDELTLDSGGSYRITAVSMDTKGQYVFEVEVL